MKTFFTCFFLLLMLFLGGCSDSGNLATIKGTVVEAETTSILLMKPEQDLRFDDLLEIPVTDGKFEHQMEIGSPEGYYLTLGEAKEKGGGRFMPVILEKGVTEMTIYPESEFHRNVVEGGALHKEFMIFKKEQEQIRAEELTSIGDSLRTLMGKNTYFSARQQALREKLKTAAADEQIVLRKEQQQLREAGLDLSPRAKELSERRTEILKERDGRKREYIRENTNLIAYWLVLDDLASGLEIENLEDYAIAHKRLALSFPDHPYNQVVKRMIDSKVNKVGKKYIDFSAPDLEGNVIKLSDEIGGKVALINLWATWCGPCIRKSREMIPLVEQYRDKGLAVVGVAGEFRSTDNLERFLEKEPFPWINLVELDRENSLWEKYGVPKAGGAMFLVDSSGTIIAKDPSADEARTVLATLLN